MAFFITPEFEYYEGDRINHLDVEVPQRPSLFHVWDGSRWIENIDLRLAVIRAERNRLLSDCDWTVLPDAPVGVAAWKAYRQALRDYPEAWIADNNTPWPEAPAG